MLRMIYSCASGARKRDEQLNDVLKGRHLCAEVSYHITSLHNMKGYTTCLYYFVKFVLV
jgi:hypothetical protein